MALTVLHAQLDQLPAGPGRGGLRAVDGVITAIGPDVAPEQGDGVLDADGDILIPGLVNGHPRAMTRPGPGSGYSRIGWHSDFQSGPHLPIWPSVAFTIHLDATSPANGLLRVVPGSHRGGTATMPPGFGKVVGELARHGVDDFVENARR
jgi:hypothetical protein